ncbi:MAG TPA: glycosyltransferase family 4 protein [Acetobacteraceae bacterium]|nr:glycosyltransferase family 4 protein [Acetobacteraceae bacterium]
MACPGGSPVVLQVLPSLVTGGVERSSIEMTEAVAAAGWTALVASAGGPLVAAIERAGGRHVALPLGTRNPLDIWRNAGRLAWLIGAERVHIVHARSRAPAWSAWLATRRTSTRFITTYHGTYAEDLPFKRRYNAVMAKGEIVIAASRFVAELVIARHGIDPSRVRVIPRGVDPAVFDPAAVSPERLRRLDTGWSLPRDAVVITLPGRLTGWKGQSVLLDAFARLQRQDMVCVLLGSDQGRAGYIDRLRRQAERLGVADRVRLPGESDDMPAALLRSDVVVHASTEPEAFGRVVIEAQAMARPVIAADLGGPVETVEDGVTGWRVPPGQPAALAAAIDQALALPPERRAAIGAAARAAVLARCTKRAMQEATLGVYRELLGAPAHAGVAGKGG